MLEKMNAASRSPLNAITSSDRSIAIAPVGRCARFSLRMPPEMAKTHDPAADFGLDIPINTSAVRASTMSIRLGPDEWLLLCSEVDGDSAAREIEHAFGDSFFSLVDVSHGSEAFLVSGAQARLVLNGGCLLDLGDAAFPVGAATRTLFGKAEIVLVRSGLALAYRIECRRSFAPYVLMFLRTVARQYEMIDASADVP